MSNARKKTDPGAISYLDDCLKMIEELEYEVRKLEIRRMSRFYRGSICQRTLTNQAIESINVNRF